MTEKKKPKVEAKPVSIRTPLRPFFSAFADSDAFCVESVEGFEDCFEISEDYTEVLIKVPNDTAYCIARGGVIGMCIPIKINIRSGYDIDCRLDPARFTDGLFIQNFHYSNDQLNLYLMSMSSTQEVYLESGDNLARLYIRPRVVFTGNQNGKR